MIVNTAPLVVVVAIRLKILSNDTIPLKVIDNQTIKSSSFLLMDELMVEG